MDQAAFLHPSKFIDIKRRDILYGERRHCDFATVDLSILGTALSVNGLETGSPML